MSELKELEKLFLEAAELRQQGDDAGARERYETILRSEPRLAEPRLELAHMDLDAERLEDAEEHARLAVGALDRGGQWVDDLPPEQLRSFAYTLLGEVLFRRAESIAAAPGEDARARFDAVWNEAADAFARASELDPDNVDARRKAASVRRRPTPVPPAEV